MSLLVPQEIPAERPGSSAIQSTAGEKGAASSAVLAFRSAGVDLPGVLYSPAGTGPHPVVVFIPGFPGYGCDFDLARALCRAGYATLTFHCRGSWGVAGSWSISHMLHDAAEVTAAVRDRLMAGVDKLDPHRIAVLGHSLGGFAALMTAAADPSIAAVVAVAAPDIGSVAAAFRTDPLGWAKYLELTRDQPFRSSPTPVPGTLLPPPCTSESFAAEARQAGEAWHLTALGPALATRPVLLIGASHDISTPPALHHQPVVNAYLAAHGPLLEHHVFATDNALSDHRKALAHTVLDFLRRNARGPRPSAYACGPLPSRHHPRAGVTPPVRPRNRLLRGRMRTRSA